MEYMHGGIKRILKDKYLGTGLQGYPPRNLGHMIVMRGERI